MDLYERYFISTSYVISVLLPFYKKRILDFAVVLSKPIICCVVNGIQNVWLHIFEEIKMATARK
jgi:hypothetical protein